jgi:hypothetical protein
MKRPFVATATGTCAAACAALLLAAVTASAQVPADRAAADCTLHVQSIGHATSAHDLVRTIQLTDSIAHRLPLFHRPARAAAVSTCTAPAAVLDLSRAIDVAPLARIAPTPVELLAIANSAYPRDWNDGALWAGRGLGLSLTAGATFRLGRVHATLAPVLTWQSNASFEIQPADTAADAAFAHPWWGSMIDVPQRPGTGAFATIGPGQSFIRAAAGGVSAGFSTENIVWGPARRNPLVLSATAPGFPHAFIETDRALDLWLVQLDGQLFWGRLTESDHFDDEADNDHRAIAGLLVSLQPRGAPGLSIGAARTQSFTWWPSLPLSEVLLRPYRGVRDNPSSELSGDNQLITLFFRWAAAADGLEVYGEWTREDHWGRAEELLRNLDASQAWTLGFQKLIPRGDNALRVAAEISHLSDALPVRYAGRGALPFYANVSVPQGHTHRGQYLGAGIGTGAESQWAGLDYFWKRGRTSLGIERARYEDDAYNVLFAPEHGSHRRDTELSLRAGHMTELGAVLIDVELGWSVRFNRHFLDIDDATSRRDHNTGLRLGARWLPGRS